MKKANLLLCSALPCMLSASSLQAQIRNPIADSVFNGFVKAYLVKNGSQTYFCNSLTDRNRAYFWELSYLITAAEDIYDGNPTAAHRQIIEDLVGSFLSKEKSDWKWDAWDDDIEWVVNIFIRGYKITGDSAFIAPALNNWKMVWNRGWTDTYGGGIWERMDDTANGGKGGLSNWSFVYEGVDLYKATGDTSILGKCIKDYAWTRTHAYDPKTGRIYEATGPRGMSGDDNSYNSGLLVNAAASLFEITGDSLYYNDAVTASAHYIGRLGASGIMTEDHPANGYFGCEQFARGLSKFARLNHLWNKYWPFLSNNAAATWAHRRTDYNLTWNNFAQNTSNANLRALEAQGSVAIQAATPVLQSLTQDSSAPATIQAEDFNYMNGIAIDSSNAGTGGGKAAGPIAAGGFLEYIVKVPAAGVYTITYRAAGAAGAIAFQQNGQTLSATPLPATGSSQSFAMAATKVSLQAGIQSIRLSAQSGGFTLDWWRATYGDHAGSIFDKAIDARAGNGIRVVSGFAAPRLLIDFGSRRIRDASISDLSGRVLGRGIVGTGAMGTGVWSIDASAMPNGVYLLSAHPFEGGLLARKLMR